ncbi:DUF4239 domain-containing protein [bacterium]|nr:DUF4239 domain-containing protein [bacterium]MBP9808922.1 DUF4239 domain-containing protein [bacterium]
MSLSPLFFWAAGFMAIALVGLFLSAKTIKIDLAKNGELIVALLAILGTLVSVLLGMLVSSADEQYRSLEVCVSGEATNINEVFRLARGLPDAPKKAIQEQCITYCEKVVSDDWPAMKNGEMSPVVTDVFINISDVILAIKPANDGEAAVQGALISATTDLGQSRGVRVIASRSTWTWRLLPLIITCAVVVLICSYLYVGKGSALLHSVLVGLVAITLGTNIGVIFLMTRPFSSEWAIQPDIFAMRAKMMRQYKDRPALKI